MAYESTIRAPFDFRSQLVPVYPVGEHATPRIFGLERDPSLVIRDEGGIDLEDAEKWIQPFPELFEELEKDFDIPVAPFGITYADFRGNGRLLMVVERLHGPSLDVALRQGNAEATIAANALYASIARYLLNKAVTHGGYLADAMTADQYTWSQLADGTKQVTLHDIGLIQMPAAPKGRSLKRHEETTANCAFTAFVDMVTNFGPKAYEFSAIEALYSVIDTVGHVWPYNRELAEHAAKMMDDRRMPNDDDESFLDGPTPDQ